MFVTAGKAGRNKVQGVSIMFNINDLSRHVTAALGAVLVSVAIIGASIGPVDIGSAAVAATRAS